MAETTTTRLGLPQWSAGSDNPERTEFDTAFADIDSQVAGYVRSTVAARPAAAAAYAGFWHEDTGNAGQMYWCDGSAWYGPFSRLVDDLGTAATDTALVLKPDGAGGVAFGSASSAGLSVIAETVLGSAQASVTFSSIPATYRHLMVAVSARGTSAAFSQALNLRMNGDTGSNYDWQRLAAGDTAVLASQSLAASAVLCGQIADSSTPAGHAGAARIFLPGYAGTTFHKQVIVENFYTYGTASSQIYTDRIGGKWRDTSAVTSLTLLPGSGNFDTGTVITLYGLATA